jgi:hypothetical protein
MLRIPTRPLVLTLALVALLALSPVAATTQAPGSPTLSAAESPEPTPGLFSHLWSLLSALWSDTGSGLDPDGATGDTGSGLDPDGVTGDTGPWLDPNG